jgi:RNA polymerase sigma factor (sigma-70 family)
MDGDFETEWRATRAQVWAACSRAADDPNDAEDIFQQVAIRAWRGYPSFRGDSAFLTWVLAIARREIARVLRRRQERRKAESSLESLEEDAPGTLPPAPAPEPVPAGSPWLLHAASAASAEGALSGAEAAVLQARLAHPDATWEQIGEQLGIGGATCAVLHCRAVPKLRVYLFTQRRDLLGGREAVAAAFRTALEDREEPLHPTEAEAFERVVLDGHEGFRRSGWRLALRSACGKVIRHLALP